MNQETASIFFELNLWITGFAYPVFNALLVVLSIWGFLQTRYSYPFAILGVSAGIEVLLSIFFLMVRIQKELGLSLLSMTATRFLCPIQAIAEYLSMGLYLVGFFWLVFSLTRKKGTT